MCILTWPFLICITPQSLTPQSEGAGHPAPFLTSLRARHLRRRRSLWPGWRLLAPSSRGRSRDRQAKRRRSTARGGVEDRRWLAFKPSQDRQDQAGGKEKPGQDRRRTAQYVGGPATRHESGPAAHTQTPALRPLQQHQANHGQHNHEVDNDDDGLHERVQQIPGGRLGPDGHASYRKSGASLHDPPRHCYPHAQKRQTPRNPGRSAKDDHLNVFR